MTEPLPGGYPDFGRYRAVSRRVYFDDIVDDVNENPAAASLILSTFVGDVERLAVFAESTTGWFDVWVQFWDADFSAGGANIVAQQTFVIREGGRFAHTFAVNGPFVTVAARSNVADNSLALRVFETTQHGSFWNDENTSDNILASFAANINAAVTETIEPLRTWPGMAHWFMSQTNSTADLRFQIRARNVENSTIGVLLDVHQGTPFESGIIMLPYTPVILDFTAQGATNRFVSFGLHALLSQEGI